MKKINNKKVIVAMSGGVDSSAAAALLKRDGFNVIGVFMKFWSEPDENGDYNNRCCSAESEVRARLVAEKINIPFYVFDFKKEFKKKIIDYFLREHKKGRTPNPCVVCNREIKFELLFKKLKSLKADYIATGHYVRLRRKIPNSTTQRAPRITNYKLFKAKDKEKDQSYFLWRLNQKLLEKALFPNGNYTKKEIRKLAKKFKLPSADAPESQEVCFIKTAVNVFLKKRLKTKPGYIVYKNKIIGKHQGLWFYTMGQRKGINLANGPYYVSDKDIKNNVLVVTKNEKNLFKKELTAKNVSWIYKAPELPAKVSAKIRYRHKSVSALIKKSGKNYKVEFLGPQKAITPGQSVVFYKGRELLGGGIIK